MKARTKDQGDREDRVVEGEVVGEVGITVQDARVVA